MAIEIRKNNLKERKNQSIELKNFYNFSENLNILNFKLLSNFLNLLMLHLDNRIQVN